MLFPDVILHYSRKMLHSSFQFIHYVLCKKYINLFLKDCKVERKYELHYIIYLKILHYEKKILIIVSNNFTCSFSKMQIKS